MLDYIPTSLSLSLIVSLVSVSVFLFNITFFFIVQNTKAIRDHRVIPNVLPWIGKDKDEIFSSLRANYRGLTNSVELFRTGYRKV